MFSYAGNYHKLTILGCILAGISTIFSMLPFVCIWFVIRNLIHGLSQGDVTFAAGSSHYAWMALLFSVLSIFLYFLALIFSHLAAFRTATNMRKKAVHHIVELPLGYFSQNVSGRLRKVIDDNAGLTEGFLAHQLPDLTGAVVMPVAVIILIFVFDWRMGICCLIPMAVSVIFLKQMMGGDNADFMSKYMTALETMNKEAVEYIRGIPVVKVFQQTIYSFKNFHNAITEYEKFASGYALKCRIPMTGFTVALNSTFVLLIPVAMIILSGLSGQISYEETVLDFLFYALFTPVCTTMMNRIMFASEQLMAAKSAVSRVEAVIQEKTLPEAAQKQKPADTGIVFKNVSFSYSGASEKALDNVSFEVPAGKTVALVGASGSGKSTATSLITTGQMFLRLGLATVIIVGNSLVMKNQTDIFTYILFLIAASRLYDPLSGAMSNMAELFGVSLQVKRLKEIEEYPDENGEKDIRTNGYDITFDRVKFSCEKDKPVLRDVSFTAKQGQVTALVGPSGGECQRLSIARALLKDAPVILLDEATASLDVDNETEIQNAISRLVKGKTVLVIAHRMRTIEAADQIVVLADGVVAEKGSHETLMKKHGLYRKLVDLQTESTNWKLL